MEKVNKYFCPDFTALIKIDVICRLLLFLVICIFVSFSAFSKIRLHGNVIDSITGESLSYANIINKKDSRKSIVADENAKFNIVVNEEGEWMITNQGYIPKYLPLFQNDTVVDILLVPITHDLSEVIVKPKKDKYSKKNNPAVNFMKNLRSHAKVGDPAENPFYSYDKYEKTVIGLNDFKSDFTRGFLSKNGKFLQNYIDTSAWTGKKILDLILKEKSSTQIMSKEPNANKEVVHGYRSVGMDERLNQDNMRIIFEDAFREINIFSDNIVLLQNRFVSPLSVIGPDFYKYFLTDTGYIGTDKCIELSFVPRNPESMGFNGKIYVEADDSLMTVRKVIMRSPHDINMNYIENIFISQSFEKDSIGKRHKTYDDVCVELKILSGLPEFYGRKTTSYKNFSYEKRKDLEDYYTRLGNLFVLSETNSWNESFWEPERMVPLSLAESRMGNITKEARRVPLFYWGGKFLSLMESGYVRTGKPSKFDFGPINTLVSANSVEGVRFRVGGMTMSPLNSHLFARGYLAYGTKDRKLKYRADVEYSFTPKKNHSYEWQRHGIYASWMYDTDMLGQHYLFTNSDNIFLSLKRKESILVTYRRQIKGGYILELPNNFSVESSFRNEIQEATRWLPFRFSNGKYESRYSQSAFSVSLRWAPGEKFIQGRSLRAPVNMDAWIFQLTHEYGPKGMFNSAFTLNRSEVSVQKRLWLSAFGYLDIIAKAGKIWSKVYYPALLWPNANLSYTIQPESYSLMNPMEFANDTYASVDFTYFGNGVLFNRLPLIRKLKMREVFTFKGLMGSLSDKNNPLYSDDIYSFPSDANTTTMTSRPYMEIGVGLDNIFTFLRVDYVWRLTYRDTPGCDKSGARISLHFSF